jgi:hypothetical protein
MYVRIYYKYIYYYKLKATQQHAVIEGVGLMTADWAGYIICNEYPVVVVYVLRNKGSNIPLLQISTEQHQLSM